MQVKSVLVNHYDDIVIARIVKLVIRSKNKMIKLENLIELYYKRYKQILNLEFKDIFALAKELCLSNPLVCDKLSCDDKYYTLMFEQRYYLNWISQAKVNRRFEMVIEVIDKRPPNNVVSLFNYKNNFPDFKLNYLNDLKEQQRNVYLVYFNHPNHFFVQLERNYQKLKRLKHELTYYNREDDVQKDDSKQYFAYELDEIETDEEDGEYTIPYEALILGLVVAVRNPIDYNRWDRGIIIYICDWLTKPHVVKVRSLDFGNEFVVKRTELRYLKKRFMQLSPQAIQCSFDGILPVGVEWDEEKIRDLVYKKFIKRKLSRHWLVCTFEKIDHFKCFVTIYDYVRGVKIWLHVFLVTNDLAQFDKIDDYDNNSDEEQSQLDKQQNQYVGTIQLKEQIQEYQKQNQVYEHQIQMYGRIFQMYKYQFQCYEQQIQFYEHHFQLQKQQNKLNERQNLEEHNHEDEQHNEVSQGQNDLVGSSDYNDQIELNQSKISADSDFCSEESNNQEKIVFEDLDEELNYYIEKYKDDYEIDMLNSKLFISNS